MSRLRSAIKNVAAAFARSAAGKRLLHYLLSAHVEGGTEAIFNDLSRRSGFDHVTNWPSHLDGFEDLAFLFSSSHLNVGTAILAFDEAAYLYKLAKGLKNATIIEIGRYKGGSTFLLAAAIDSSSHLYSYDWYTAPTQPLRKSTGMCRNPAHGSTDLDQALVQALRRFGIDSRVKLEVANSQLTEPPSNDCDLVFIDGDHSQEGVTADFFNWAPHIPVGGNLLFHDAIARRFAPCAIEVTRLVETIRQDYSDWFDGPNIVGSLAHFLVKKRFVSPHASAVRHYHPRRTSRTSSPRSANA